jgi:hypothetical protein
MLTPVALSKQLRDLIPDSQLHLVEKVGHMLPLEAPERVNQEILDFVESVVGRRMRHPLLAGHATKRAMVRRFIDKAWALCRGKSRPSESLPVPGDRPELRTGRRRRLTGSRVAHWRPAHHVREVSGLRDHPPERE